MSFLMSAQEIRETLSEPWPEWQGAVINGAYPLQRMLHGSDHSAVFLTEYTAQDTCAAAIKIVPAERVTLAQLAHWRTAASLSHPHLIRLLDAGLYQLGGRQFLFVVMEYADETLAEVLPQRALTVEEVREMLLPTLDALAFLHGKNLVHGQLKPASFLVVNDRVKLASDTVRPAGEPRASRAVASMYDPPEAQNGALSPAGDIWGLGVTLVEALTQCLPWPGEHAGTTSLPPTLPAAFVDTIQRCLSHDPARRPTTTELAAEFKRAPDAPVPDVPRLSLRNAPAGRAPRAPDAPVSHVPPAIVRETSPAAHRATGAGPAIPAGAGDRSAGRPAAAARNLGRRAPVSRPSGGRAADLSRGSGSCANPPPARRWLRRRTRARCCQCFPKIPQPRSTRSPGSPGRRPQVPVLPERSEPHRHRPMPHPSWSMNRCPSWRAARCERFTATSRSPCWRRSILRAMSARRACKIPGRVRISPAWRKKPLASGSSLWPTGKTRASWLVRFEFSSAGATGQATPR